MNLFHVWIHPSSGIGPYVFGSFNSYERAEVMAKQLYAMEQNDTQIEITNAGLIVWGPFVKGGKYEPK